MEKSTPSGRSYWDFLGAALRALDAGDLPSAEREFDLAQIQRNQSPGRVFITEKITDGLSRLIRGDEKGPSAGGRWTRRAGQFRQRFLDEGERIVREAVRLAELRPEDDADTNQPVLESALFLVGRSRLFSEEPSSAVPLLKGLFRTAGKTGRPFDVQLIRHDIPLTEEDRLWLARKGPEVLAEFVAHGALDPGSSASESWVQVILQLLHPRYFGSTGRLEEERAWLEASTTDRLLERAAASVELYRSYLEVNPESGPRSDEARLRLLELLGNIDAVHFSVPDYTAALGVMQAEGWSDGRAASERFELARERIEYRRPDRQPGSVGSAWASVGLETDGRVAVVFWWEDQPRDIAFWAAGDDPEAMIRFLEPCAGRIVATDPAVTEAIGTAWQDTPAVWSVRDYAVAFLEPSVPESGLDDGTLLKIGLGDSGSWRGGWKPDLGHHLLDPPRRSSLLETWQAGVASGALLGGLVWLAILSRVSRSDPSLRAGVGAMARRGDPAAGFLYQFLNLDQGLGQTLDSTFTPWTLPLLWTRPDPFGWTVSGGPAGRAHSHGEQEAQARPDLGHNDLAIVTTGDPGAVLTAWGDGRQKWRVVLDRLDRMADLASVAVSAIGPVTLIPSGGRVHTLQGGLGLLENLLTRKGRPAGRVDGLLPLFHWLRLVETHNGDLLDFFQVRPRPGVPIELYDKYQDLVSEQERVEPVLESAEDQDPWATQFSQRVRKAGLVAGLADGLTLDSQRLDSLWGVFEGSDASWVFLDSAAIHWHLHALPGVGVQDMHALLHTRGKRHLSLLVGAVWMRSELEDLLGTWLAVFGSPYCLALTNARPPLLRLVDRGTTADAWQLAVQAHAGQVAQVAESIELAGSGTVLLPARGSHGELWRRIASGEIPLGKGNWSYLDPLKAVDAAQPRQVGAGPSRMLLVPILDSLADNAVPIAQEDTTEAWIGADQERLDYLVWRRRLCGLEIASLLAGPWETVEIMDSRWWRILEPEKPLALTPPGHPSAWSADKALALAAPEGCRLFHLPGAGAGQGRTIHPNTMETVRLWFSSRATDETGPPAPVASIPESGRVMIALQEVAMFWDALVRPVARAWEAGQIDHWVLLVGDWVPSGAAAMVAAGFSPGISVWSRQRASRRPAPLLWCRSADLQDPELKAFLKQKPPAAVLALDIQDWLPSEAHSGQQGATALRALLDCPADRLILQGRNLTSAWLSFLTRETDALILDDVQAEASGQEPSPSDRSPGWESPGTWATLPDTGQAFSPEVIVRRMRRLLENLRPALGLKQGSETSGSGDTLAPGRQLVSLNRLSELAGLPPELVASSFRLLRWVARLSGDSLSDAGAQKAASIDESPGHTLTIPRRFAELEHILGQLEQHLSVLFPMMLGSRSPGLPSWFDLEYPPVRLDPEELALLDCFLAASGRATSQARGLIYECPRGILNSTKRLVGTTTPGGEVLADLRRSLALFGSRLKEVMGSAIETGDGFLVETGLRELRAEELEFLTLGSSLGFWRWTGPACEGALHVVDLLTTAESPTVQNGTTGWELLAKELALGLSEETARSRGLAEEPGVSGGRQGRWPLGPIRSLLPRADKPDEIEALAGRVTALVHPQSEPGLLVISGLAGTGRHQALIQGLLQAQTDAGALGEITVFCPDTAAASSFIRQCTAAGQWSPAPQIRVVGPGTSLPRPNRNQQAGGPGSDAVVVMLEIHRFEAETRYQIAHLGRGRRLVMTTDPAAATEPWEHLFLTVPRTSEVVRLEVQRLVSRKVWSEIRQLLPEELRGKGQSLGSRKGDIQSVYAVNLDQCLARMVQDVEAGSLPHRFRLVGPLISDLDFLGASLREKGWLAVPENDLDALLLPGPREVLAAATGALAELGLLGRFFPVADLGSAEAGEPDPLGSPLAGDEILTRYLGPEAGQQLGPWWESCRNLVPDLTLGGFFAEMETWPWARSVLADPPAAVRAETFVNQWAEEPLAALLSNPMWEAWWCTAREDLDLPVLTRPRPLVTLTAADQMSGVPVAAGVYLCLGTELPRQHYNVLSRMTDEVLILYKEQSPLADQATD